MNKQSLGAILLVLSVLFAPHLQGRRRKKIVDKYQSAQKASSRLVAQNEPPRIPPPPSSVQQPLTPTPRPPTLPEEASSPMPPEKPQLPPSEPPEKVKDIYLNFDNADLKTFVDYIGNLKNINVVTDPKIAGN